MDEVPNDLERLPEVPKAPALDNNRSSMPTPTHSALTIVASFTTIFLIALTLTYYTPAPARTFVGFSVIAAALVVGGLITLIVLIPAAGSNPDVKTEFFSARAAYLCVVAGLLLFGVVVVGAVVARVMLTAGGR
jgi:hypothetical protein